MATAHQSSDAPNEQTTGKTQGFFSGAPALTPGREAHQDAPTAEQI